MHAKKTSFYVLALMSLLLGFVLSLAVLYIIDVAL